jgi:hypothetical protein
VAEIAHVLHPKLCTPGVAEAWSISTRLVHEWAEQNAELLIAYTAMFEREGLPLERYRTF